MKGLVAPESFAQQSALRAGAARSISLQRERTPAKLQVQKRAHAKEPPSLPDGLRPFSTAERLLKLLSVDISYAPPNHSIRCVANTGIYLSITEV